MVYHVISAIYKNVDVISAIYKNVDSLIIEAHKEIVTPIGKNYKLICQVWIGTWNQVLRHLLEYEF